jgi:hypothetical protein
MTEMAQGAASQNQQLERPAVQSKSTPRVTSSKTIWVNRNDPTRQRDHVVFRSYWKLDATETETLAVLSDYEHFSDWWGRTFLESSVAHRPESGMVGLTGNVKSRGFLPYQFGWKAEVTEADETGVTLSANGDFNGVGRFRRPNAGEDADLCFDWDILITKPILRFFTPYACPIYLWNHAYAMANGARSLQAEIERRRG